ncbi:MAG TPA: hypothetical protein VGP89_08095 [Candidatus Angelobacter sp.]|jgi:hypothetical protein|nr:hypothetical protein [Candidatus Angelobacter sp.]
MQHSRLVRVFLTVSVAAAAVVFTGCAHKPKPVHVPLVQYTAHLNDKDCKRIGTDNPPRFRCNNVMLDPKEIDATGRK